MHLRELTAYIISLPLRKEIKHASATRRESTNVLVCARLADGTEGWGEGVPRQYVTGEMPQGAVQQLAATDLSEQLSNPCSNWSNVIDMCDRFELAQAQPDPRGCHGNALRCAIELSVLDAFGRHFGEPVSEVAHHDMSVRDVTTRFDHVRYSTTITAESPAAERLSALKMRLYGFRQCKVKVGVEGADDAERLQRIRRWIGPNVDLRLDANEAWSAGDVLDKLEPLLPYDISCIEQPVPHEEIEQLAHVRQQLPVPVMLDESLTSMQDAEHAIRARTCDLFNIRLSKCGGFLGSLRIAARAKQAGLGYQLGCHPGESGILSAAGRHWAVSVRDIRYLEGSYDRHVLRELLTNEDITFGYGGRAPALAGPGLGITINQNVLSRLVQRKESFRFQC